MPTENLRVEFDDFDWAWPEDSARAAQLAQAWQRGRTGIALVDAGMAQLWQTGWMHNRVRMVTASLLVKNFGLHWRVGEQWFWDTLLDADLASNTANWQWVAGSGADAAPISGCSIRNFKPRSLILQVATSLPMRRWPLSRWWT
nr:FAD-binding domain-containing protein [Glutamicibacter sp. M10]